MKLTAWPITTNSVKYYQYSGGDPDGFLCGALDPIGWKVQKLNDGSHLAEELLDPFVLFQFIAGIQGKYTINGTPFYSNWRLLPCATRMATRLGALELADALEKSGRELASFEPEILDDYDATRIPWDTEEGQALNGELSEICDARFHKIPFEDCTYGTSRSQFTGAESLNAALADWVCQEMPREVLPNQDAVMLRLKQNHVWACENVEGYELGFTSSKVGAETYQMLKHLGLRFERTTKSPKEPHLLQVVPYGLETSNGQHWIRFEFGDGCVLADADTLTEHARRIYSSPRTRLSSLPPYLLLADAPSIEFSSRDFTTRLASRIRPFNRRLSYRN